MARKYTDSSFVIQTTANISAQWSKASNVEQIPFSLIPFTAKSTTSLKVCPSAPYGAKAYITAQRSNPREFLFETEKLNLPYVEWDPATMSTPTAASYIINCDTTGGILSIPLPAAATVGKGFVVVLKIGKPSATPSNNLVSVPASGADTIDGAATVKIDLGYGAATFISDGSTAWYII